LFRPQQNARKVDASSAHVWSDDIPVAKPTVPKTPTGVNTLVVVLSPTWPQLFCPQHHPALTLLSAQVCCPITLIDTNVWSVETAIGRDVPLVDPIPS